MKICGKEYYPVFNAAAYFAAQDKYGDNSIIAVLSKPGLEGFEALCWTIAELAKQGELVRRYQGLEHGEIISEQAVRALIKPMDLPAIKQEVLNAIITGFNREEAEDDEVDVGLAELQKKKGHKAN